MKRRHAAILLGILASSGPRPARAETCAPDAVAADMAIHERWPELPGRVRALFAGRADLETCARVALSLDAGAISVVVTLPDGRSAARAVSQPEDVPPVVEALLVVPERAERSAIAAFEPVVQVPEPPAARVTLAAPVPHRHSAPTSVAPATSDRGATLTARRDGSEPLRVELSVAPGARFGDGQTSVGLAAFSFLELAGWLAGFEGRLDQYQRLGGGSEAAALELAALGGRRLRFETLSLDFTAGPALVLQGTATNVSESASENGGGRIEESSSSTVLRLLLGARLNFSTDAAIRPFAALDGEFGPERAPGADLPLDAPRLPLWTIGVAVGASMGGAP